MFAKVEFGEGGKESLVVSTGVRRDQLEKHVRLHVAGALARWAQAEHSSLRVKLSFANDKVAMVEDRLKHASEEEHAELEAQLEAANSVVGAWSTRMEALDSMRPRWEGLEEGRIDLSGAADAKGKGGGPLGLTADPGARAADIMPADSTFRICRVDGEEAVDLAFELPAAPDES
jgi:hypothetical protein